MVLADYTESELQRSNPSYVHGSLGTSTSGNVVMVTYEEQKNTTKNTLIGTGAGAGVAAGSGAAIGLLVGGPIGALVGAAIGFFTGSGVGSGIGFAIPENETINKYFDANSGEYLGSTESELVTNALSIGVSQFERQNFENARDLFQAAYDYSESGSAEQQTALNNRNVTELLMEGINHIDNRNYTDGIENIKKANNDSKDSRMDAVIREKRNELAEKFFNDAMTNWNQAWIAESDEAQDRSDEAAEKFSKSEELFRMAAELVPENNDYTKWTDVSSLKIDGNHHFNEGLKLQNEGDQLKLQSKFGEARAKYLQAQENFENGLRKSGDQRFHTSIDFVKEQIEEVEEAIRTMGIDFGDINVNRPKEKHTDESKQDKEVDITVQTQDGSV